jgi:hypothetical protein
MIISSLMVSEFYALEDAWKRGGSLEVYNGYRFVDCGDGRRKMRMKYRLNAFVWYRGLMFSSLSGVERIVSTEIGEDYSHSWQTLGDDFWGYQLIRLFRQSRRGRER